LCEREISGVAALVSSAELNK